MMAMLSSERLLLKRWQTARKSAFLMTPTVLDLFFDLTYCWNAFSVIASHMSFRYVPP